MAWVYQKYTTNRRGHARSLAAIATECAGEMGLRNRIIRPFPAAERLHMPGLRHRWNRAQIRQHLGAQLVALAASAR